MEDVWIMDSGCSRHMIGHRKWFSGLNPVSTKEYIKFGDNGQGKVMGVGLFRSPLSFPREVAFVRNLGFNLVSFRNFSMKDLRFVLRKVRAAFLMPRRPLFALCYLLVGVDLTSVFGPARRLVASPSTDIWKWHRRLGHLSFDLASRVKFNGPNPRIAQIESREGLSLPPPSSWQDGCRLSHSRVSGYDLLSG
ncbi:LOW QUALITY PROTEIN: hypothetical protein U9M48_023951 [Paspalum notatum var. saurae]|uniref:Retrovirus-related Pol polyprotein from transposon TNT 1-94-like beta-barrel domain-containing protein n=1 Tax=Paspalum notatum var. saurae TaxID=547442 RepID=A0AAQ3TQE0_PASNO